MESENIIFDKIKSGDKQAFEQLFREMYPALCNFANKIIGDLIMSEEVVQDIFYKLWDRRQNIEIRHGLSSYIYTAVRNQCLVYLKHLKIREEYAMYISNDYMEQRSNVEDYLETAEIESILEETLESLPAKRRRIFELSRFEGLKYHEIAEKLSVSVKTIEANMTKALKAFRKNLSAYLNYPS
jgi:RNA polymerase sigma-70 factor, ECF subfamily